MDTLQKMFPGNRMKQYIESYCKKHHVDETDMIYEVCSLYESNGNDRKKTLEMLQQGKIGLKHPSFQDVSKRIVEMDHFMDKPFEVVEGVNNCGKCSSQRTLSYSRQTRGGDEGMTVYVFCIDCKFRYTMNS